MTEQRCLFHQFTLLFFFAGTVIAADPGQKPAAELVEVRRIWGEAGHSAFTDLLRFHDNWYCVFREGPGHVSPDGVIRVIRSGDGVNWSSAAKLDSAGYDLRDPKISAMPDGKRLMLLGGATVREGTRPATESQSFVSFSTDGSKWEPIQWAGPTNLWLWRVTWHQARAYGIAYNVDPVSRAARKYGTRLLTSHDGAHYTTAVPELYSAGGPTEATVRFAQDDTAYCLQRRDGKPDSALLGASRPPYTDWQWKDLGQFLGGPDFIQIPDGRWLAAGRMVVDGKPRTMLCELDVTRGALEPLLTLPSGGDSSYPGLVWHEGLLWMSYYSAHEKRNGIYLARMKIPLRK